MRGSLNTTASSSPKANVVSTDRMAKAKVHTSALKNGPARRESVNMAEKLSKPTTTFQPGVRVLPSSATNRPLLGSAV